MSLLFVLPLRSLEGAKQRLREEGRADVTPLVRAMARAVIAACAPRPVLVVTDDDETARFAETGGALVLRHGAPGLNAAVRAGYRAAEGAFDTVAVVPGDLIYPEGLGGYEFAPDATLVADHHGTGTALLVLPAGLDPEFFYGPDSAAAHRRELGSRGLVVHELTHSPWAYDLDRVEDLASAQQKMGARRPPFFDFLEEASRD